MRNKVDIVELEDLIGAGKAPVNLGDKGVLKTGKLGWSKAVNACVVCVGANVSQCDLDDRETQR